MIIDTLTPKLWAISDSVSPDRTTCTSKSSRGTAAEARVSSIALPCSRGTLSM